MSYLVQIVDRETGEAKCHRVDLPWEDHSFFYYSEGNWSCDCNRVSPWDIEVSCNTNQNRYVIVRIITTGGVILSDEADNLNPDNDPAEMLRLRDSIDPPAVSL